MRKDQIKKLRNGSLLLKFCSADVCDNEYFVKEALKFDFSQIYYASERLQNSKDFILTNELNINPAYLNDTMLNDEEIVERLLSISGLYLNYVGERFKKDRDYILKAIRKSGFALSILDDKFKEDKELVLEAIKDSAGAIIYARGEILNDAYVFNEANKRVKKEDVYLLSVASDELKNNKEFVIPFLKKSIGNYFFLSDALKDDKDIIMIAIDSNYNVLDALPEKTINNTEYLTEIMEKINDRGALFYMYGNIDTICRVYKNKDYKKIIDEQLLKNNLELSKIGLKDWLRKSGKEVGSIILNEYQKMKIVGEVKVHNRKNSLKKF